MNLSTTRQAIHDALAWGWQQKQSGLTEYLEYLTQIQKTMRPDNSAMDLVEAAYICAAIDNLGPPLTGWVQFAYAPEPHGAIQDALASKLRFDLFPLSSAKKHVRLFTLAQTSLEDYRFRLRRQKEFPNKVYADRMSVDVDHWARDWKDRQDRCIRVIVQWDKEGVGQVSRMVKCLRGENDDDSPTGILEDLKWRGKYA